MGGVGDTIFPLLDFEVAELEGLALVCAWAEERPVKGLEELPYRKARKTRKKVLNFITMGMDRKEMDNDIVKDQG